MLVKVMDSDNEAIKANEVIDRYVSNRTLEAICGCTGNNVYEDFLEFCNDEKLQPITNVRFKKILSLKYGTTSIIRKINKKSVRIIVKNS